MKTGKLQNSSLMEMTEHGPQPKDKLKAKKKLSQTPELGKYFVLDEEKADFERTQVINHQVHHYFSRLEAERGEPIDLYQTLAITDAFHKIGKYKPEVATQYFSFGTETAGEMVDQVKRALQLEKKFFYLKKNPELEPILDAMLQTFSGVTLRLFVEKASSLGSEDTAKIFKQSNFVAQTEATRYELLEAFLLDETELQLLAQEKLLATTPIPLPEHEVGEEMVVELEIPSLKYDPAWYEYHQPDYVAEKDDADYRLPPELAGYHNLEQAKPEDFIDILSGLRSGNEGQIAGAIERATGHGPVPPEKLKEILESLKFVSEVWGLSGDEESLTDAQQEYAIQLAEVEKMVPLPESAKALTVHNQKLNRDKVIEPFSTALRKRLLESAVSAAVDQARGQFGSKQSLMDEMITAETKARAMYRNVVENGVPVFKDFATYLCQQDAKGNHSGEFYVGRDTLETMYPAAHAARFGKMSGAERHKKTVWVNVSRTLTDATSQAVLKKWLIQEEVTEEMLGIDGGYIGNSPARVFEALNPELSQFDLNSKIRLVQSDQERKFNPRQSYIGIVKWMEMLPKFTNRSQGVAQNEFGKYYVVDGDRRSPVERALAWTVQHAVWRELINHDPVAHPMSEKEELTINRGGFLERKTDARVETERTLEAWRKAHAISYLDVDVGDDGQAFVNGDFSLVGTKVNSLPAELIVAGDVIISADQVELKKFLTTHGFSVKVASVELDPYWDDSPAQEETTA